MRKPQTPGSINKTKKSRVSFHPGMKRTFQRWNINLFVITSITSTIKTLDFRCPIVYPQACKNLNIGGENSIFGGNSPYFGGLTVPLPQRTAKSIRVLYTMHLPLTHLISTIFKKKRSNHSITPPFIFFCQFKAHSKLVKSCKVQIGYLVWQTIWNSYFHQYIRLLVFYYLVRKSQVQILALVFN